jgi:hypothetical protein
MLKQDQSEKSNNKSNTKKRRLKTQSLRFYLILSLMFKFATILPAKCIKIIATLFIFILGKTIWILKLKINQFYKMHKICRDRLLLKKANKLIEDK